MTVKFFKNCCKVKIFRVIVEKRSDKDIMTMEKLVMFVKYVYVTNLTIQ